MAFTSNIRLEEDRLCTLVMIGARPDGTKELIAVEDGFMESKDSWGSVMRDLKRRGMRDPELTIGDGALGFWAALRDVWPATREQRDWVHRIGNVLDKLPKRLQPKAKAALHDIMKAESREAALLEIDRFEEEYGAKNPKAVETLRRDQDKLLTFFDFPAEHWVHNRTSNPRDYGVCAAPSAWWPACRRWRGAQPAMQRRRRAPAAARAGAR
jgi:putative transposase